MNRHSPYIPPHPWDDDYYSDRHRGRGRMVVERGRPIDIEFAGFRSDTYTLQQHGWEIAERRLPNPGSYEERWSLVIRHPELKMSGLSVANRVHSRDQIMHGGIEGAPIHLHVEIGMPMMVREIRSPLRPDAFQAVDCRPYAMEVHSPHDLYYMPYFRPIAPDSSKDIFLREASVQEIMQIALDKQAPEQAEIRARRKAEADRAGLRRGGEERARLICV